MPARAPASIDMLQIVIRASMESLADGLAAVLQDVALATAGADLRDDRKDDVLGGRSLGEFTVDVDRHRLEGLQRQGLSGEDVLHLGGADAECQRAESAVG
ncbi:hypothetical protein GCM10025876_06240 [Demequina litorisediminis]|uniref:Uncharacterized protein n=1 Tax=Demequina litorisediminis TaxID=1849022 RepID=A0ABQ6I9F1_9MICO|nr:hypothetical protein GCM10025876_06240 [Demequina litorisediminis]